jgi:hypothetical protein
MINRPIVCRVAGVYSEALTRGTSYQVVDYNDDKKMVRIKGDNGRLRWFYLSHFNLNGEDVVDLVSWKFDDEVTSIPDETNWIEISMQMSDSSERWCILYTPERLRNLLQLSDIDPPGLHIKHMIVVRSYKVEDIQSVLDHLNQDDELIGATLPLNSNSY